MGAGKASGVLGGTRWLACGAAVATILLAGPQVAPAGADGDPASDVLLAQNAYYPYQPRVSPGLEASLDELLRSAERSRRPLKVAIIGTVGDLGADPTFFGHPQAYAEFLDREISFNDHPPLLVVMPAGFGLAAAGSPAAISGIAIEKTHGSDGLVRSAIRAAAALLRRSGPEVKAPAGSSASSGGGSPTILFAAPVVLLAVFGLFAVSRNRRRRAGESAGGGS